MRIRPDSETRIIVGGILARHEYDLRSKTGIQFMASSCEHLIASEAKTHITFAPGEMWYHMSNGGDQSLSIRKPKASKISQRLYNPYIYRNIQAVGSSKSFKLQWFNIHFSRLFESQKMVEFIGRLFFVVLPITHCILREVTVGSILPH